MQKMWKAQSGNETLLPHGGFESFQFSPPDSNLHVEV
jgi:hypothetical protein